MWIEQIIDGDRVVARFEFFEKIVLPDQQEDFDSPGNEINQEKQQPVRQEAKQPMRQERKPKHQRQGHEQRDCDVDMQTGRKNLEGFTDGRGRSKTE